MYNIFLISKIAAVYAYKIFIDAHYDLILFVGLIANKKKP